MGPLQMLRPFPDLVALLNNRNRVVGPRSVNQLVSHRLDFYFAILWQRTHRWDLRQREMIEAEMIEAEMIEVLYAAQRVLRDWIEARKPNGLCIRLRIGSNL